MHHIGHKCEVPPRDDSKGWRLFYDYMTAPGYGSCKDLDEERDRENSHWVQCKLRKDGRECDRCAAVAKRVAGAGEGVRWNDVVY